MHQQAGGVLACCLLATGCRALLCAPVAGPGGAPVCNADGTPRVVADELDDAARGALGLLAGNPVLVEMVAGLVALVVRRARA